MNKIDFLAIGDIVVDDFIKLKDAHVTCKIDETACELCVRFGDKVPFESSTVVHAVGNGPNAAVSASRLGLQSAVITNVGDDLHGQNCIDSLKRDNVMIDHVTVEKGKKTNYHYVLWYEVDRTILVNHTEFDYKIPQLENVGWVYLTSLASNSLPYHMEIAKFLKNHPETKLAFQPGTFQMKLGVEKLQDIYTNTYVFFCNLEEAQKILNQESRDLKILSEGIKNLGPKIVCISDGPKGAYLYYENELWHIPMYPDMDTPEDRTGAGDAFSSTFTAALALGMTPVEALSWGPINSMSVVHEIGAQKGLLSREKLEEYLKNAPAEYVAKKI